MSGGVNGGRPHDEKLPGGAGHCAAAGVNLSLGQGAARVHILKDIDLNIGSGEAIGLVGPSGSGKSTLLMVMAGLERADTGTVTVAGENLGALDEDALARFRGRNVGIVFQSFHLIPTMTALENVAVPLELAGVADAQERARDELAAVGLANGCIIIRPNCPAASSSASRWPARWRPIRRSWWPTSRPEISTRTPASRSSICCSPAMPSAAPRWFWSRMIPRWPSVAGAWCGCARAASTA